MPKPIVGDRYLITWEELGKPTVRGDYKVSGLGTVVFDDADAHYAANNSPAQFVVRQSRPLGNRFVVVSRMQPS